MTKAFQKEIQARRAAGNIEERLSYGGSYDITPKNAVTEDWLFALDEAKADLANVCRLLSNPDEEKSARRAARRHCAELAAIASAMHAKIEEIC